MAITEQRPLEGTDNAMLVRSLKTEEHSHHIDVIEYVYDLPTGGPFGWMCGNCSAEGEGFRSVEAAEEDAEESHRGEN